MALFENYNQGLKKLRSSTRPELELRTGGVASAPYLCVVLGVLTR